jgi:2-polyprenyl-3-methyl-5-hydroxy-6-metoxy-1,4-benzoquinol methylase
MGSTELDSLLEAGASAAVADIDNIMSLIRAHVQGNGNGNGSAPTPPSSPAAKPQPPAVGEALKAQAQFNHELMGALRILGERFLESQSELAHLQEQQRAAAEQTQGMRESLTNIQGHSTTVEQELTELKRELAKLGQDLAGELESSRRQRHEQIRHLAQLEERVRQINTAVLVTGRRVDGVASRAYNTEQTLDGVRERVENELAGMGKLRAEVAKIDARALDLEQRLGRVAGEMTQQWQQELAGRDTTYREQLAGFKTGLESVSAWFNQELVTAQERLQSELKALQELVSAQAQSNEAITGQIKMDLARMVTLEQKVETLSAQGANSMVQYDHRFDELTMRVLRAERATSSAPPTEPPAVEPGLDAERHENPAPRSPNPPMDYFMFALQHRGSVDSVRERQAAYVDLFHGRKQIVDLGCGRGEFLELFSGNGTHAVGVDANKDMIDFCREHGLDVVHADLFEYLQSLPDTGLDGIFSAQVIEHMAPDDIRMLIRLCSQKLGPDGLLVLETVNPLCPLALTNFWLDPTHVRPVLPKLLTFMLEEAGFTLKALRFNSPIEGSNAAPSLETVNEWPSVLDQYQDYAAVASSRQSTVASRQ